MTNATITLDSVSDIHFVRWLGSREADRYAHYLTTYDDLCAAWKKLWSGDPDWESAARFVAQHMADVAKAHRYFAAAIAMYSAHEPTCKMDKPCRVMSDPAVAVELEAAS